MFNLVVHTITTLLSRVKMGNKHPLGRQRWRDQVREDKKNNGNIKHVYRST
jgi:hypothetical protein